VTAVCSKLNHQTARVCAVGSFPSIF